MELTFKEPETITVPIIDEKGKNKDVICEIIPLEVEDMKLTVIFQELQLELDELTYTKEDLENQVTSLLEKSKEKSKNKAVIKKRGEQLRKLTKELRVASIEREKFVIEKLLPTLTNVVDKGLVIFGTEKKFILPSRHRTLPKMMAIAVKILNITTETDTEVDTNFQLGKPQKSDSKQSEPE